VIDDVMKKTTKQPLPWYDWQNFDNELMSDDKYKTTRRVGSLVHLDIDEGKINPDLVAFFYDDKTGSGSKKIILDAQSMIFLGKFFRSYETLYKIHMAKLGKII